MYKGTRFATQSCSHEQTVLFIFSVGGTAVHSTYRYMCTGLVVPAARGAPRCAFVHSCGWWLDIQLLNIIFTGEIYKYWNLLPCDQSRVSSRNVVFVRRASDYGQCADVRLSVYTVRFLFMWQLCCEDSGLLGCYNWSVVPNLRRNVAPLCSGSSNLSLYLNCLPLKRAALQSFETSVRAPTPPVVTVPTTGHCTPLLVVPSQTNPIATST